MIKMFNVKCVLIFEFLLRKNWGGEGVTYFGYAM